MNRLTAGVRQVGNLVRVRLLVFLTTFMVGSASAQEPLDVISQQGKLYRVHCANCHGDQGRGDGKAARFLFPKARDFSSGKMRIVSTENRVANAEDIRGSIERGFPGTSMQSWKHLGDESIKLLVAEVIRLRKQGVEKRVIASWEEDSPGVLAEPAELERIVQGLTHPGEVVQVPDFEGTDERAVVRGREVYRRQSCHSCHGNDGSGSWKMDLIDGKGRPSWATDLRFDPLKGPSDEGALARRI
ncbi:MAG: c-type cytochrome, partial [Pirellulaceae bacterium]